MATANFRELQHDLPLYVLDTSSMEQLDIDFAFQLIQDAVDELNRNLTVFTVDFFSGYYGDYQLWASVSLGGFEYSAQELFELGDDDIVQYTQFDTAQEFKEAYARELEELQRRFEIIASDYGLTHVRCIGRASNGEAFYEEVQ